jgi:PIN domain nuclease of toxin-antitoxin system
LGDPYQAALGKITLATPPDSLIATSLERFSTEFLTIQIEHAMTAPTLPVHHKDPFDRMLVAQALAEELTLITADEILRKYACSILWAH